MSCTNSLSVSWLATFAPAGHTASPTVDSAVSILVGLPNHLIDLVVGELLADRGHDVTELGRRDEAVIVAVENLVAFGQSAHATMWDSWAPATYLESFPYLLLGIGILHLPGHHRQELYV